MALFHGNQSHGGGDITFAVHSKQEGRKINN